MDYVLFHNVTNYHKVPAEILSTTTPTEYISIYIVALLVTLAIICIVMKKGPKL